MTVYPAFYDAFRCRAGACRHSCCRGWEIDVDEDSLRYYAQLPGPLGGKLRASLVRDSEGAHFALGPGGRCPFWQTDGLCALICALGEDALCDICALHPRFYLDFGEHTLCGLGLSCEAACALLLDEQGPLLFNVEETGARISLQTLLGGIDLRFVPLAEPDACAAVLDAFARTEPIDDAWTAQLQRLRDSLPQLADLAGAYRERYVPAVYDRILQYILYRQLDKLDSYGPDTVLAYARLCAAFVFLTDAWSGDTAESLRRWSEQIEYSTENVEILLKLVAQK